MKIEWDHEKNVITVGKAVISNFTQFQNSAAFANYVLRNNDIDLRLSTHSKNLHQANKEVADALGCSRSTLYNHFNKLQLKVFVSPIYDILKKVGYSQRGFNSGAIRKICKHKEKLVEAYDDKLYNILPIICETGKSPKELKSELKGTWKVLSKNSLNKNKHIAKVIRGLHEYDNFLEQIRDIPTTVLKNFHATSPTCMRYLANNFKGKWKLGASRNGLQQDISLFVDTVYLATQMEEKVDPSWTPRRVKEEHDRLSKEINARKYSKDLFDSTKEIVVKCLELEEYKATLLESAFDIADEGTQMGHCVGLYADSVRQGEYLVYSVIKNGERSSTIGIQPYYRTKEERDSGKGGWRMQQHYGKYNKLIENPVENELATKLIHKLNGAI